jgi:hypothetical protein
MDDFERFIEVTGFVTNRQLLTSSEEVKTIMANLNESGANVQAAVDAVSARVADLVNPLRDALAATQEDLAAERAAYSDLVAAEDAEDVGQNQALADAQAAVDAHLAEAEAAVAQIDEQVAELNEVAAAPVEEPVDETPVEEPVVEPAPFPETPEQPEENPPA